ncbi:MAG: DNA-binding response regulator, partial [Chloroflexi bacterium]
MIGHQQITDRLRVVIIDDHTLFRDGLSTILGNEMDIEVVGQGGTAQEAIRIARDLLPEIILLDIDIPGGGLEAARVIANDCPVTKIVILTASENDDHLISALKTGATAYILKGVAARELVRILHAVAAGESYVPPALAASLLLEMHETSAHKQKPPENPINELTERE